MEITIDDALPDTLRSELEKISGSAYGISNVCDLAYRMGKDDQGRAVVIVDIKDPFGEPLEIALSEAEVRNGGFIKRIHDEWGGAVSNGLARKLSELSERHGGQRENALADIAKFEQAVRALYALFSEGLKPHMDSGMIRLDRGDPKPIQEARLPPYELPTLVITLPGDGKIRLDPKGIMLVGSRGRVDLKGPGGELMIVLQDDGWFFVARSPRFLKWAVTAESIQEAIALVSG
jgi:hypothetical protein